VTHDVTTGTSDVGYIAPFWAVMMTDRDNQDLVNMQPFQDQFQMMAPVVKMYEMPFNTGMEIDLTFLTNCRDIALGNLLVLLAYVLAFNRVPMVFARYWSRGGDFHDRGRGLP